MNTVDILMTGRTMVNIKYGREEEFRFLIYKYITIIIIILIYLRGNSTAQGPITKRA
jgi:hypothetical protein